MAIGDSRDLAQTRMQLNAWLRDRLPHAEDLTVSELRAPGMGFSNETLLFDLTWQASNAQHVEPLVIRFKPAMQIFPDYDLGRQYRVMQLLAPTGIPVPRVRWQEADAGVLGSSFYVMDRVEGIVPPDQPSYHAADVCTSMTPAQRAALWWHGLETMTRIHQLDWRASQFRFSRRAAMGPHAVGAAARLLPALPHVGSRWPAATNLRAGTRLAGPAPTA